MRIGLVACAKSKRPYRCSAREMYWPSALFRKASTYCAQEYDAWYVLSAEYGLLSPEEVIQPYDRTLKNMPKRQREAWGRKVSAQLKDLGDHQYFVHAGLAYLTPLSGLNAVNVLAGLRMGERLKWYDEKLAGIKDTALGLRPIDSAPRPECELTVAHLERAARWYRQHTRFDDSYVHLLGREYFLHRLRSRPEELADEDVLRILIKGFLNKWGCRLPRTLETARAIRKTLVSVAHAGTSLAQCSLLESDLSHDTPGVGGDVAQTYEVLRTVRRVGPTTASKILHVLNPSLFVMWDDAIRLRYGGLLHRKLNTGADYVVFLAHMQALGNSVSRDFSLRYPHGVSVESYLSEQLRLELAVTLAKFLDEYNWVTIVRGLRIT